MKQSGLQTMSKQSESNGFTAIELLITLFIAAAFLVSGYQLYNLIIKDGGETRTQTRASNVAYDYLQRYKPSATTPCTTQTPLTNAAPNPVPVNLSNVTVTVQITCPYGITSSVSKVQVNLGYGNPQQTISNATYVSYPGLVTDSLVLNLDGGSRRSIINWDSWTVGAGGAAGYSVNGDGNSRVMDTNPWGVSSIIWDVSNQDVTSDADGGWNGSSFNIDNTKMYRFTTFVRRKTIGNGSFYLGTSGGGASVLNRSNGAVNSNPYFCAGWWGNVNQWYLVVGYVWPVGSGTGAAMPQSGIYALDGTKIVSNSDFVWQSTTTSSNHRSYLYYSTDVTTNQQWYQPRVDIIDGTEPTVTELLNNAENTWVDSSGNGNNGTLIGGVSYSSANGGVLNFDGVSGYVEMPNSASLNSAIITVGAWVKPNILSGHQRLVTKNSTAGYLLNIYNNTPEAYIGGQRIAGTYLTVNQWVYLLVTIENARLKFYINGIIITDSSYTGTINGSTSVVRIGADGGSYFNGQIGNIHIYSKSLSLDEVAQNFNALRSHYGI